MSGPLTRERKHQPPERLILLFGLLAGCVTAVLSIRELQLGRELDFHAYYFAGRAVTEGEPFIGWAITEGSFLTDKAYVYLPITAPLFSVYGLFSEWYVPYAINTVVLLGAFYLVGRLSIQYIEARRSLKPVDRWLILAFYLFSGPTVISLYRGNIDPIILLLLVGGFLAVEGGRDATGGTLWAIASLFKLFPAFLGVWLLYRRSYRGIAAALGVGIGATLLSILLFGVEMHVEFVEFIVHERSRDGAFVGGLTPTAQWITLRRPLSQFGILSGHQLTVLSLAILSPFLFFLYRKATSELDRLGVYTGTVVALLITVVPSTAGYVVYLLFPLVPLVYLVKQRTAKACFLAGLALITIPLYPQHIQELLETLPLSAATISAGTDLVYGVLTYGSVGLWGFVLVFTGCVLYVCFPGEATR